MIFTLKVSSVALIPSTCDKKGFLAQHIIANILAASRRLVMHTDSLLRFSSHDAFDHVPTVFTSQALISSLEPLRVGELRGR